MNSYKELPILFVENYDIISIEYLNKKYDEFQNKTFDLEKLNLKYWKNKIRDDFVNIKI